MAKWLFITECKKNNYVGTGHIKRSITFAKFIKKQNNKILFIINRNIFAINLLKAEGFEYKLVINNEIPFNKPNIFYDYIFLDVYNNYLSNKYMKIIKESGRKVIVITDSYRKENISSDFVIATNEAQKKFDYDKKKYLIGPKYIIIDSSFYKKINKINMKNIEKILITFGGYDPYNVTLQTVRALKLITKELKNVQINILIGDFYLFRKQLEDKLIHSNLNFKIFQNVKNMSEFISKYDYAITAGGNTLFELLTSGIPSSIISQNMRQHKSCKLLSGKEIFDYIGRHDKVGSHLIAKHINIMIKSNDKREMFHKRCLQYFDNDAKEVIYKHITEGG